MEVQAGPSQREEEEGEKSKVCHDTGSGISSARSGAELMVVGSIRSAKVLRTDLLRTCGLCQQHDPSQVLALYTCSYCPGGCQIGSRVGFGAGHVAGAAGHKQLSAPALLAKVGQTWARDALRRRLPMRGTANQKACPPLHDDRRTWPALPVPTPPPPHNMISPQPLGQSASRPPISGPRWPRFLPPSGLLPTI